MCFGVFVQVNEGSVRANQYPVGYVVQENGCWDWVGTLDRAGYGKFYRGPGRGVGAAHRILYERLRSAIPAGMELDHKCRNRSCVNPDHLEPVSHKENVRRGVSPVAQNLRKTHCPRGHSLDTVNSRNTRVYLTKGGWYQRSCRECTRIRERERTARRNKGVGQ